MILRSLILVFLCFCTANQAFASFQKDALSEKYEQYRDRLRKDFMRIGEGKGKSIPASNIHKSLACGSQHKVHLSQNETGAIRWGDALITLGDYCAVLASEYAWYRKSGQSTVKTTEEIYYAILAINRLDESAESYLSGDKEQDALNGFLIRDDISDEAAVLLHPNLRCFNSDYVQQKDKNTMSQDQLIGLLFGLRALDEHLPKGLQYKDMNISAEVKNITHRLINYIRSGNWTLFDPTTGKAVERGAVSHYQAFAIAKAGQKITGINYQTDFTKWLGRMSWKLAQYPFRFLAGFKVKPPGRKEKDAFIYRDHNNAMMLRLAVCGKTWRKSKTHTNAISGNMELFSLIYDVWYKEKPMLRAQYFENELLNAPKYGPRFYGVNEFHVDGWASTNRWVKPQNKDDGSPHRVFWGAYNGLDFMLLHNYYRLAFDK